MTIRSVTVLNLNREPLLKKRRVDETETTNEQIAPLQTHLTNKFKKKSELGALLLDMRDIVGRLEFSIKTGNFAGVSVGSSIIMESDNKLGYVSDLSPNQQARMTIQANALHCYYLRVIKYVEQIPQQAQRRCESYNFIKLYAGFISLTFVFVLFVCFCHFVSTAQKDWAWKFEEKRNSCCGSKCCRPQ